MSRIVNRILGCLAAVAFAAGALAIEPTWEFTVRVSATVKTSPPQIVLNWPQDTLGTPSSYTISRRISGSSTWGSGVTLPGSATSYTDSNVQAGVLYEYQIQKSGTVTGYGYIVSGIEAPLVEDRGRVILVVDTTHATALASELARLEQDLVGDGWTVVRQNVSPTATPASVKSGIVSAYNADRARTKAVFLFGRIPVPYSGNLVPDGHSPQHFGAWPADVYYGEMDGSWTDSSVNNTGAETPRNRNVPGDGKFDQTALPSAVELQVGRVDLSNMPGRKVWGGPATFPTEVELLRRYLNKDHQFRHKRLTAPARGVIHDSFGTRNGEAFAASGYRNFAPFFGAGNIITLTNKGEWVPWLKANAALWAYGCGAGSYQSIGGLGNSGQYYDATTIEVVESDVRAVFTMLFGSWLGDWDSEDNIMRGILATPSFGLTCSWAGRPHWFYHHMAMGETIGYSTLLTQNNGNGAYRNQLNNGAGQIHAALMGDPTLRMHVVAPPSNLKTSSTSGGVQLTWTASPESVLGYFVYRASSSQGPFARISGSLVNGTSFTDTTAGSGTFVYMVRAVRLETSPSGTYFNASQGVFSTGTGSGGTTSPPPADTTAPTVTLTSPAAGSTVSGVVTLSASASDNTGVAGVQFKVNGANQGAEDGLAPFQTSWDTTALSNGSYTLTAVARDAAGNQGTSAPVTVQVSNASTSTPPTNTTPLYWVDDALPAGAIAGADGGDSWMWVTSNPAPFSGTRSHQSAAAPGLHQHYFDWATQQLSVAAGAKIGTYIFLDPANLPEQVMLQWNDGSWEHRAYWGANKINYGVNGTASRRYVGPLPPAGQWVRLEVPAADVGLEGRTVRGMAFSLFGGRASWDAAGVFTTSPPDSGSPGSGVTTPVTIWIEDSLPAGAKPGTDGPAWSWGSSNPSAYSGSAALSSGVGTGLHQHYFDWASTTLPVAAGEVLVAHVYLDPANPPSQVMLQWNNGNWEHRAYWGENRIAYGTDGTASRRRMGNLPPAGQWVRLEVPASQVGLEGSTVKGMAFSMWNGRASFDQIGKQSSSGSETTPPPDSTTPPPSSTPTLPAVSVSASETSLVEDSNLVTLTFTRTGSTDAALKVNLVTSGTADRWFDYRRVEGDMPDSITIAAGSATAKMVLYAVGDGQAESTETAIIGIAADTAYTLGTPASVTLSITDKAVSDTPNPGTPPPSSETPPSGGLIAGTRSIDNVNLQVPKRGDHGLRILNPSTLELVLVNVKQPDPAPVESWNFVDSSGTFRAPAHSEFQVLVNGQPAAVQSVGFRRRPLYVPLVVRDLRLENALYLKLQSSIPEGATVEVKNPSGALWNSTFQFQAKAEPLRYSPAIHVNQEGYVPSMPKSAMVGYYLGTLGELEVAAPLSFRLVNASGQTAYQGTLKARPDVGYTYTAMPYQRVLEARFDDFTTPGEYRLVVPGLGASLPFRLDDGIAMLFTRTYALGLYHQRCGTACEMPYTRHVHGECHKATVDVPSPQADFPFTWNTIASRNADYANNPRHTAVRMTGESTALYPFIKKGKIDVSGGHHDAGDYSKYTLNSAGLIHYLVFAVDAFPGVAQLDNLGLPESGDGISDLLQEAKWEADFLAKLQDSDGGFYFLVYPKNRSYESNVTPDRGDPQVVWPKTTAATAASVAALAQIASSPAFKKHYPAEAAAYLQKAQLGWQFLTNAIARHGKDGSYQKITHYGDVFMHDDELAWAAAEMFAATGQSAYFQKLVEWYDPASAATLRWGWWRMYESYGRAARSYAFAARSGRLAASQLNSTYLAKCLDQVRLAADDQVQRSRDNAYGSSFPLETKRVRSAGWYFSSERAFDITVGYQIDPKPAYLEAILANLNYEAGANPVNASYITGLGWKRQREIVHQYAQNDRRIMPPTGIPQGNIHSAFSYLDLYKSELSAMCFPQDGAATNPYPFYDRWSDAFNVTTEFVHLDQARALASIAFVATLTPAKSQPWKPMAGTIKVAQQGSVDSPMIATLEVPGMSLEGARIVWEAKDQEPAFGTSYTVTPKTYGTVWIEAEAHWPDGRRVFAMSGAMATNNLPVVTVAATDNTAREGTTDYATWTLSRTGDTSKALVVKFKFSGTASKWMDYRRLQGDMPESVEIPAGAASVALTVYAVQDSENEGSETAVLTLSPDAAYNVGSPDAASIQILDKDQAVTLPSVTVTATDASASEAGPDPGAFTFTRTGDTGSALTVQIAFSGTASPGTDWNAGGSVPSSITIPAGTTTAVLAITPIDDTVREETETVTVTIGSHSAYTIGANGSATIQIADNDQTVALPTITLSTPDPAATEDGPTQGRWKISRTGSTSEPVTVQLTYGGTAENGVDYRELPTSVTIPAGSSFVQLPLVPIPDRLVEGRETATCTLEPDPAYKLGSGKTGTIAIADSRFR